MSAFLLVFLAGTGFLPQESAGLHDQVRLPVAPPVAEGVAPYPSDDRQIRTGESLWSGTGCLACHDSAGIEGLDRRTDVVSLARFLEMTSVANPGDIRPLAHDFGLTVAEGKALSVWLLRRQLLSAEQAPPQPGLSWECYELEVTAASLPDISGLSPVAVGASEAVGVGVRTRDDHFLLRFNTELRVPESGEWTFHLGSDDSSWLWLDGELLISNEGLAPLRTEVATLFLAAGPHSLEIRMTEAGGEEILELQWEGPGFQTPVEIPLENMWVKRTVLVAPEPASQLPSPPSRIRKSPASGNLVSDKMMLDGCLSCHFRNGQGGIGEAARRAFSGDEDLGFEGRLPPDLDQVGHRLRQKWIGEHLRGAQRARPYLHARCVVLEESAATAWAELFAGSDSLPGDDLEPGFSIAMVESGRLSAGIGGKGCIACHQVAGHNGPGIQAMDLALQGQRLKPQWFREWLQNPNSHRPGTRMPTFWTLTDDAAIAEQDALRAWMSLGVSMPLPDGLIPQADEYVLRPTTRPLLHGCALRGLSARCLAVGTPQRTHFAYDLEHLQLAWIWRGEFLDVEGTWRGRNLGELEPLGGDHVVLPPVFPFKPQGRASFSPKLLGWRLDEDGWPTFRIGLGRIEIHDTPRIRWTESGSVLVRTISAFGDGIIVDLPSVPGLSIEPTGRFELAAGETREVIYRW